MTDRQLEVIETIARLTKEYGYPPTMRELMAQLGISSPNGMECHLKALERKGKITREPGKSRTLRLTPAPARREK